MRSLPIPAAQVGRTSCHRRWETQTVRRMQSEEGETAHDGIQRTHHEGDENSAPARQEEEQRSHGQRSIAVQPTRSGGIGVHPCLLRVPHQRPRLKKTEEEASGSELQNRIALPQGERVNIAVLQLPFHEARGQTAHQRREQSEEGAKMKRTGGRRATVACCSARLVPLTRCCRTSSGRDGRRASARRRERLHLRPSCISCPRVGQVFHTWAGQRQRARGKGAEAKGKGQGLAAHARREREEARGARQCKQARALRERLRCSGSAAGSRARRKRWHVKATLNFEL
jgi:hypothetical protein